MCSRYVDVGENSFFSFYFIFIILTSYNINVSGVFTSPTLQFQTGLFSLSDVLLFPTNMIGV